MTLRCNYYSNPKDFPDDGEDLSRRGGALSPRLFTQCVAGILYLPTRRSALFCKVPPSLWLLSEAERRRNIFRTFFAFLFCSPLVIKMDFFFLLNIKQEKLPPVTGIFGSLNPSGGNCYCLLPFSASAQKERGFVPSVIEDDQRVCMDCTLLFFKAIRKMYLINCQR